MFADRTCACSLVDAYRANHLSTTEYAISGTATELLQSDDATFGAFAAKVQADVESTRAITTFRITRRCGISFGCASISSCSAGNNEGVLETIAKHRPTCIVGNAINYQRYDL